MKKSAKLIENLIDFAIKYPEISPNRILVINMKKEAFNKLLTPARVEIIRVIKETKPKTVRELVKHLGRPLEPVSRDLRILENYGILEFVRSSKTEKPKIEKEMILIPLAY